MKYISPFFSDARNKLGGDVFARNRAGVYVRARVKPTNPQTTSQQANRAVFSTYATAWRSLSSSQITAWNQTAAASLLQDSLGNSFQPTGLQLYISCNKNIATLGGTPLASPPARRPTMPALTVDSFNFFSSGGTSATVYMTIPADFTSFTPGIVLYMAGPLSAGIRFVGPAMYRCCFKADAFGPAPMAWYIGLVDITGIPAVGSHWAWKIKYIDPTTGYAGPITVGLTTVLS